MPGLKCREMGLPALHVGAGARDSHAKVFDSLLPFVFQAKRGDDRHSILLQRVIDDAAVLDAELNAFPAKLASLHTLLVSTRTWIRLTSKSHLNGRVNAGNSIIRP